MSVTVNNGDRVRAQWFEMNENASLAGVQLKFSAVACDVVGTVKKIRGNRPVNPTEVAVLIVLDGQKSEIWIRSEWIVEVLS